VAPTQAPHNFAFERSVLRGQNAPWARIDYAAAGSLYVGVFLAFNTYGT
jgi:hypothetical protein